MRDFDPLTDRWDSLMDGETVRLPSGMLHTYSRARHQAAIKEYPSRLNKHDETAGAPIDTSGVPVTGAARQKRTTSGRKVGPGPNCYSHTHH